MSTICKKLNEYISDKKWIDSLKTFVTPERHLAIQQIVKDWTSLVHHCQNLIILFFSDRGLPESDPADVTATFVADMMVYKEKAVETMKNMKETNFTYKMPIIDCVRQKSTSLATEFVQDGLEKGDAKLMARIASLFMAAVEKMSDDEVAGLPNSEDSAITIYTSVLDRMNITAKQKQSLTSLPESAITKNEATFQSLGELTSMLPKDSEARTKPLSVKYGTENLEVDMASLTMSPALAKLLRQGVLVTDVVSSADLRMFSCEEDPLKAAFDDANTQIDKLSSGAEALKKEIQPEAYTVANKARVIQLVDYIGNVQKVYEEWLCKLCTSAIQGHIGELDDIYKKLDDNVILRDLDAAPPDDEKLNKALEERVANMRRHKVAASLNDVNDELQHIRDAMKAINKKRNLKVVFPNEEESKIKDLAKLMCVFSLQKKMSGKVKAYRARISSDLGSYDPRSPAPPTWYGSGASMTGSAPVCGSTPPSPHGMVILCLLHGIG